MLDTSTLQTGDVVRYSDIANPGSTYVILQAPTAEHPHDFKMLEVTEDAPFRVSYSSCRQRGWELVQAVTA